MATRFKNIDRNIPMLLPPDLRDWVAEDDLVHFVIAAVERVPVASFVINERGSGDEQYPPHLLLALLIYCYANGIFSSRRIERASYRDVAVRYLCADTHPDHDTICVFRRNNKKAVAEAFVEVLELARELKLLRVGMVSVDGTHIRANASKDRNVAYQRAGELREQLRGDIEELLEKAEQADRQEDDPQRLPEQIDRREKLLRKMDQARARLEARAKAQAEAERAEYEGKLKAREQRTGSCKGPRPKRPGEIPEPQEQINLTDADSRLMRKSKREAYTQSYNAQAVVDAEGSQLIVGQRVSDCPSDANELEPDLRSIPPALGSPTAALADCGYVNGEAFERLGSGKRPIELYVSVHREDAHAERRYEFRPAEKIKSPKAVTDPGLTSMAEKLRTESGRKTYRKRACTVEPVFGIIKHVLGFRQFLLRGLANVRGEWNLVCLAYNLKRLHRIAFASSGVSRHL